MPVVRKMPAVITELVDHGEHVYSVGLQTATMVPRFTPGQFLHLAIDPYTGGDFWPESRVFSIASSPSERQHLEITYAVKGSFTSRMERELTIGGSVWLKLPYGDFVVAPMRDAVLFAGGTGITAFTAYLLSLEAKASQRTILLYGARNQELFVYRSLVDACVRSVPALDARFVDEAEHGRLRADMAWPDMSELDDPLVYLSGPPAMIASLTQQLIDCRISPASIRVDAWE
jgi:ferredoxin-NADP reductase